MKAQREPFAECPKCHQFTLRVASEKETSKLEPLLDDFRVLDLGNDEHHILVCDQCGFFEALYDLPWGEWHDEVLQVLKNLKPLEEQ